MTNIRTWNYSQWKHATPDDEDFQAAALTDGLCAVFCPVAPGEYEPCLDEAIGACDLCGAPYCKGHEGGQAGACCQCVGR